MPEGNPLDPDSEEKEWIRSEGHSSRAAIRVQTLGDALDRFRTHPESKSADPEGNPSNGGTIGILHRLPVEVDSIIHIGKETNLIEQQEEGVLDTDPQATYPDGSELDWIRSKLNRVSIPDFADRTAVSRRMLYSLRRGDRRPSAKTLEAIVQALVRMLE